MDERPHHRPRPFSGHAAICLAGLTLGAQTTEGLDRPDRRRNVGQILLAQALQCALAQKIGIALALLRELHNCLGDDFVYVVATLGNSKRYASHFERDAHDARRLAIKSDTVQERGDRHGVLPPRLRRETQPVGERSDAEPLREDRRVGARLSATPHVIPRGTP